ncbi:response regulator [Desulfosporosinus sp. OT]|uniref:response regulator n=1 Tax=Desulfosporosinus sp. OT TaxID=913865 RepID=UPI000223B0A9|nr:response regulator [Desulfosporosinus sp. OT]EGW38849.1 response regulator [Desulfosporosinus sp. OT]
MKNARHSVLIVDDNSGIRKLLQEVLSNEGYYVATAASGQEALMQVQRELPDLVLLDLKMPRINGFELKQKLKEIDKNIRIIIVSGYAEQELVKDIIKQNADYVLSKPFDLEELQNVVAKLLNSKQTTRPTVE